MLDLWHGWDQGLVVGLIFLKSLSGCLFVPLCTSIVCDSEEVAGCTMVKLSLVQAVTNSEWRACVELVLGPAPTLELEPMLKRSPKTSWKV